MRRIGFLAAFLLFILTTAHAQWTLEDSHTTADLRGIDNVGGGVAWASGTNGTVLRTEDGGYLWQSCSMPPGAEHLDFRGVQGFDAETAIVMSSGKGDLSRLYKTTDGCATWKLVFTNPDTDGFWDAIVMTDSRTGTLIGDPVRGGGSPERSGSAYVFPTYRTVDGGQTWSRDDGDMLSASVGKNGQPVESIFAASNSSLLVEHYTMLFLTGGTTNGLHYLQYDFGSAPASCKAPCRIMSETGSALALGETAGGFSLAANYHLKPGERATSSRIVVAVGGDFTKPDSSSGTAAVCRPQVAGGLTQFTCEAAQTPPHGYRSSVAYDAAIKTWITVGPTGTDISTDDGRNWRAVRPDAALHEAVDADRNWNALSLPFVVGTHGRIGKLDPAVLAKGGK
jgi:photosystem II stability/assembly factor-like uncharacterized protein